MTGRWAPSRPEVHRRSEPARASRGARCGRGCLGMARRLERLRSENTPGPWSREVVRGMLSNDLYRGISVWGRTRNQSRLLKKQDGSVELQEKTKGGRAVRQAAPMDDWTRTEVPALRIVSDELWSRVQARRKAAREAQEKAYTGKPDPGLVNGRLLSGIARCPRCGGPMGVCKGRADKFYRCSNRARHKVTKPDGTRGTRVWDQPPIRIAAVDAAAYQGLEEGQ